MGGSGDLILEAGARRNALSTTGVGIGNERSFSVPASDRADLFRIPRIARPFVAAALVVLLLISAWLTYRWYAEPEAADAGLSVTPVEISAPELAAAYDEDAVGAQTRFDSRTLRVTGIVKRFSAGVGDPVITLGGSDSLLTVTATFDKADTARLGSLQTDGPLTISCREVYLVAGSPALDDCALPSQTSADGQ